MKSCLRFSIVLFVVWWDTDDRQIEVDSQTDRHTISQSVRKRKPRTPYIHKDRKE